MSIQQQWQDDSIDVLRQGNLVYIRIHKCASTYYKNLLLASGWQPIRYSDIDWTHDHVFGFIMEPMLRRAKGLVEDIATITNNRYSTVTDLGSEFFKGVAVIGVHTLPISSILGERMNQVDWIPLYQTVDSESLLKRLLDTHDVKLAWDGPIPRHESDHDKRFLIEKVKVWSSDASYVVYKTLAHDIELYNQVIARSNLHGQTWAETSWLGQKIS